MNLSSSLSRRRRRCLKSGLQYNKFLLFLLVGLLLFSVISAKNYTFEELLPCGLNTLELMNLGPNDYIEPCVIFDVGGSQSNFASSGVPEGRQATITMVHVTPSGCGNHRDGAVTGIQYLNDDNGGKGIALGYNENFFVKFRLVSVVAGNPATLSEQEYDERHVSILNSMITDLQAPYIIGSCSFASSIEKQPARDHSAIVMAQVGPPGFYQDNDDVENDYVFGFHINSDDYPLPAVQSLGFVADEYPGGPAGIPVRVIYRQKSEFFYSTCRSAIDKLVESGFTDMKEILYDHAADHDGDGEINQFDEDFLRGIADEVCPPGSADNYGFHPALFVCTLTEQDYLIQRWMENGCRPTSLWATAATWGWANTNPNLVPYFQGGGQWHEALDYSDKYFDSGYDLLLYNQNIFGYLGTYDQVVSYAIPVLYAQHLLASYRVEDNPDPIGDFQDADKREQLRRAMIVLNVETIFGQVAFNDDQRNIGRGAAGSQWLPTKSNPYNYENALVSPFLQAEADTVVPSPGALPCDAGQYLNETMRNEVGSLLADACVACPVDTFTSEPSQQTQCTPCPEGSSTEGLEGSDVCIVREDNLISPGILAFGYIASCLSYICSAAFIFWLVYYRADPVVRVSQIEFLMLICVGTLVSTSTVIALSFQAGTGDDTTAASRGCAAAPFLYAIGWVLQYSSLSAKTYRLFSIMRNKQKMKRVVASAWKMAQIVAAALAVDLVVLICWVVISPLEYVRSEESTSIDEENGIVTISTVGRCVPSDEDVGFWVFAGPIIGFHVVLLVGTNVLLYNVREVGDRYQEQKYVAMASALMCEVFVVGIPVLVSIRDSPNAMYIVLTAIIALDDIGILCCIFLPKVRFQRKGLEEGIGIGETIMRETHRRASTREYARRDSSMYPQSMMSQSNQMFRTNDGDDSSSSDVDSDSSKEFNARVKFPGNVMPAQEKNNNISDSLVSVSIIEETEEDLKNFDSSDRSNNNQSTSSMVYFPSIPEDQASVRSVPTTVNTTRNYSMERQSSLESMGSQPSILRIGGFGVNTPVVPAVPMPEANNQNQSGASVGQPDSSEQMLSATQQLMDEHARMMKATAEIMQQHEALKQKMMEANAWKPEAKVEENAVEENKESEQKTPTNPLAEISRFSDEDMKQRLLESRTWSMAAENDATVGAAAVGERTSTPLPSREFNEVKSDEIKLTGAQALWVEAKEAEIEDDQVDKKVQQTNPQHGQRSAELKSQVTLETAGDDSDLSSGAKSDPVGEEEGTVEG